MSEKRYPTRMHEVLGVEGEEIFTIKGSEDELYLLDVLGTMNIVNNDRPVTPWEYRCAIVNGIIRKPRLTEEQVKRLRALIALEAMYLAKNKDGSVGAFTNKPTKNALYWNTNDSYVFYLSIVGTCLSDLVSWSDPEPLDILATLKANGVGDEK